MTRLSGKTIIDQARIGPNRPSTDFDKSDFDSAIANKGNTVIFEKAYLCACKSKESDHSNMCHNCGGVGWIFANPTRCEMIITGIALDNKLKEGALREWGMLDMGAVKVTSYNEDKLSYMDKVTITDATAEHNQIVYLVLDDDNDQLFAYTKYDIVGVDNIAMFVNVDTKLKRLIEGTDYTFRDNVLLFNSQYNSLLNACVTIRYIHHPVFHIIDIVRESMTSPAKQGTVKLIMPVHAIAKRAHLIANVENFDGDRLLDNSWKATACDQEVLTKFQRQLRYATPQDIYDNLTPLQREELEDILNTNDSDAS